jgi:hypothetical protein
MTAAFFCFVFWEMLKRIPLLWQGKYKYKAWEKLVNDGVTPADAEKKYIELVEEMKQKHGYDASKKPEAVGAS